MSLDAFIEENLPLSERMNKIKAEIQMCDACSLGKYSINAKGDRLPGHGDSQSRVLFVAQNPSFRRTKYENPKVFGTWENRNDRMFIENLASVGIPRKDVFVTNIVKCSTLSNEPPSRSCVIACQKILMKEVGFIRPRLIVPVGGIARTYFKGTTGKFTKWSGTDVFSIWHPAYVLRQNLEDFQQDHLQLAYFHQFRDLATHPAFREIKTEPFEVKRYDG